MDAALTDSDSPLLCFVDEVLRGTNTVERIAASTQILHQLSIRRGVYCFAATHDIELTHLLDGDYDNYHFEEDVKNQLGWSDKYYAIRYKYVLNFVDSQSIDYLIDNDEILINTK